MKHILALVLSMLLPVASSVYAETGKGRTVPRLVLQITVDQLRGDLTRRYLPQMGAGGFRYLLENGVVYENAQ